MKIRKIFVTLLTILMPFAASGQGNRERAAVVPLAVLGEMSPGKQAIIHNRLRQELSAKYSLVSQIAYDQAEKEAFQSLSIEQCTVAQCLKKIQELLQVDALFALQAVTEEGFTQLTLNMVRSEETRVVGDSCQACSVVNLTTKVGNLARQLLGRPAIEIDTGPTLDESSSSREIRANRKVKWEDLSPAQQWDCDVARGRGGLGDVANCLLNEQ